MTQQVRQTLKVLQALASAIAAEGVDHVFAVMGDANQDIIVELCEKHELKYARPAGEKQHTDEVEYAQLVNANVSDPSPRKAHNADTLPSPAATCR
jgi:hypothetical protein